MMDATDPRIQNPHLDPSPFEYGEGDVGVLLVHGFTATSTEMQWLGRYLAERGFLAKGVLLPAHGETPEAMLDVKWTEWADCVGQGLSDLNARCRRVVICGESMGALLALHAAASGADVSGVVALAPAVRATNPLMALGPLLRHVIRFFPKDVLDPADYELVDTRWQGYQLWPVPAAVQLGKLQRVVRKSSAQVTQPLLMILGRLDETIDAASAQAYFDGVGSTDKELVWMDRSSHCVAIDVECDQVGERVAKFVERVTTGA